MVGSLEEQEVRVVWDFVAACGVLAPPTAVPTGVSRSDPYFGPRISLISLASLMDQ